MNVGDVTSSILIYTGIIGLVFVLFVKIFTSFYRQYMVHYECSDGSLSYNVVKAFSKYGAAKKVTKLGLGLVVTKVVKCREGR